MIIEVRVKSNSKQPSRVQTELDGSLLVYVHDQPIDGKANLAIIALLCKYYGVSKSRTHLLSGQKSKQKLYRIDLLN